MKLNEKQVKALENKGFHRWTKGTMDRLYINAETLGLEVEKYKSGNVSYASYRGERISNRRGSEMLYAKTYVDIATGELHATNWTLEQNAQQLYDETMKALEEAEKAAEQAAAETESTETEKEEQTMSNNYSIKEKIVKAGNSKVFRSWHENAGVTEEEFLEGLRWLCADPMTDGHLTRELGCIRRADSGYTPEQLEILGEVSQPAGLGLHRLTRVYDRSGEFVGFYDESGVLWSGAGDRASISAHDRV